MAKNPYTAEFNGLSEILGDSMRVDVQSILGSFDLGASARAIVGADQFQAAARAALESPAVEAMASNAAARVAESFSATASAQVMGITDSVLSQINDLISPKFAELTNGVAAQIASQVSAAALPVLNSTRLDQVFGADIAAHQVGLAAGLAVNQLPAVDLMGSFEAAARLFPEVRGAHDDVARRIVGGLAYDWFNPGPDTNLDEAARNNRLFAEDLGWIQPNETEHGSERGQTSPDVEDVAQATAVEAAPSGSEDVALAGEEETRDDFDFSVEEAVVAVVAAGADLAITAGTLAWVRVVADAKRAWGKPAARRIVRSLILIAGAFTLAWWAVALGAGTAVVFMWGVGLLVPTMASLWEALGK